jgi:UDP-N-acetylmuramate--alanine ligase
LIESEKRYHFVGIGGAGMSGLASVLLADGAAVSGSDLKECQEIKTLRQAGAAIELGHHPRHVDRPLDGVIVSSAVAKDNVEIVAAKKRDVPILFRLHALASLLERYRSVGIAGTHGKSTTSAMTATIFRETQRDPSFLIGAQCPALGGNAHLGTGDWFVAEIDESDGLFVAVRPTIAVVTNIGKDHLQTYRGLEEIERAFGHFVAQAEQPVLAADDPHVAKLARTVPHAMTVGLNDSARLRAVNVRHLQFTMTFDLVLDERHVTSVRLRAPGEHNVRNALCALGAAHVAGIDLREASHALESFALPHRRFELLEENGVTVIDDYAHLPEEVEATLSAIRAGWPNRRVVAVFQPHRYSRTRDSGNDFGTAFSQADVAIVTEIYPARESPLPGVTSQLVVDAIRSATSTQVHSISDKESVVAFLEASIKPGDFIVSFGAGDIWTVTEELATFLTEGRFLESRRQAPSK